MIRGFEIINQNNLSSSYPAGFFDHHISRGNQLCGIKDMPCVLLDSRVGMVRLIIILNERLDIF